MPDSNLKSQSLVPIKSTKLAKVGDILKITEKMLSQIKYVPFLRKNGKYIYVDSFSMSPVFRGKEYDIADTYLDGLASVYFNFRWGFIDNKGKEVKDSNTSWVYFINAAISYYAGSLVYKYFKKKEAVDNSQKS